MFESIKKLKEIKELAKKSFESEFDSNGREIIPVQVTSDDSFLSPYSLEGKKVIDGDVADFLDNAVKSCGAKNELHIKISSKVIDDNEKNVYSKAIKNYYGNKIIEAERRLKNNTAVSVAMTIIAVIVLILYTFLKINNANEIILELIDIAAWVFAWEAVDLFFIERRVLRYEQSFNCKIYSAKISFIDL